MGENKLLIPGAIVVAGLLIAGALFFAGDADTTQPGDTPGGGDEGGVVQIEPVDSSDHMLGNPDAPIKIVEYSDIDCPFCQRFHSTMQRVIQTYGEEGQIAWVYRHFPLDQIHPDAREKAEASECVASLSDNETFWKYLDILYERDETASQLDEIAQEIGIDSGEFQSCLDSGNFGADVEADYQDALAAGGQGTPYSLIVVDGEIVGVINGAQPYENVASEIDRILQNL